LGALIGNDDMGEEFVSETHVHAKVSEKKLKATLRGFFGGSVTRQETHEAGAGVDSATVAGVPMRVAGRKRALKIKVNQGAGSGELVGVTTSVEREYPGARTCDGIGHRKVVAQVNSRGKTSIDGNIREGEPNVTARTPESLP